MNQWLDGFVHRIPLSIWIFIAGGVITFLLGSGVAIIKSIQAARANPVDSLQYE